MKKLTSFLEEKLSKNGSSAQLAEDIGVSRQIISYARHGRSVSKKVIQKIAEHYGEEFEEEQLQEKPKKISIGQLRSVVEKMEKLGVQEIEISKIPETIFWFLKLGVLGVICFLLLWCIF